MCRLLGFCGEASPQATALLRGLLLSEEGKNPHGAGLLVRTRDGRDSIQKKGIRGRDFLVRGFADFLWSRKYEYCLGHVRYMTTGTQSDENAHPFGFKVGEGWVWGMQNGSINIPQEIAGRYGISPHAVDSATFFKAIAHLMGQGVSTRDAIEELTEMVSAKADFAFVLLASEGMYLWRSPDRPLCIFDARRHGLGRWFASTKDMFSKAWEMAGIEQDLRQVTYFEAKPYRLYFVKADGTFEVSGVRNLRHQEREKPKAEVLSWAYPLSDGKGKAAATGNGNIFNDHLFDPLDGIDEEALQIGEMEDDELVLRIAKAENELQALKEENSLAVIEWQSFLRKLEGEFERRRSRRKETRPRLYTGRSDFVGRHGHH